MMLRSLLIANVDIVMGGGEVGLLMLAEGLTRRGHRPLVAVPGTGGLASHLDHVAIDPGHAAIAADLRRLATACDVVHVYSGKAMALVEQAGIERPLVYHVLMPDPHPLDTEHARRADVVICNSRATAARFTGDDAVEIVYNGVAEPRVPVAPLEVDPMRRTVAIVGGTVLRKGQLDALPALLDLVAATDDVDVVLIGRTGGPAALRLRRVARASAGRIRLMGYVPSVADHLGQFALVLVPSRSEGFGRVAVEALRAGVPVLARRVDGLAEALGDLADPWLPIDRGAWGERIRQELEAPRHTATELRAAAHRFDPERFVSEIEAIHLRLARSAAEV